MTDRSDYYYILFYVMVVYVSNHRIHFNRSGMFNVPAGRTDFSLKLKKRLLSFTDAVKAQNVVFSCTNFENYDYSGLTERDLVYIDPPCLISCAVYNRQTDWNVRQEKQLFQFMEELDRRQIRFAYSGILKNQTAENKMLIEWLKEHKYNIYCLKSSSEHSLKSMEILVTNY